MKIDSRQEYQRLADFIARWINEAQDFSRRGLWLSLSTIEVLGRPPERIRLWARLHFLALGSPFYNPDPTDHLLIYIYDSEERDELHRVIQERLRLQSPITVEFAVIDSVATAGVVWDVYFQRTPVPADVNERDALGRTALFRAATRGYAKQVEELLAAGANVSIADGAGRTLPELAAAGKLDDEVTLLIEQHSARNKSLPPLAR